MVIPGIRIPAYVKCAGKYLTSNYLLRKDHSSSYKGCIVR